MHIVSVCLTAFLALGCTSGVGRPDEAGAHSWPIFRGDAGLRGSADVHLPDRPSLRWAYRSGARTASSPVVYRQTVYWADKRGRIYGIDAEGRSVFSYDFATAMDATPLICDSVLYVGRIDGFMSALSLARADTLWNFETMGQISASPNAGRFHDVDALVFGSYDNYLYCLDRQGGHLLRRYESGYYINGAVALQGHCYISGGCDAWLRIVNGESGVATDSLALDTYIPASPAVDGHDCYIADHAGNVYHLDIRDGRIRSHRKMVAAGSADAAFVSVPAVSDNTLYILSDDRHLYAIGRRTGQTRWRYFQKGASGESSPLVCRDKVIVCTRTGIVSLLRAADGALLWEYDAGEAITASPAAIHGRFYILTAKGTLLCFG